MRSVKKILLENLLKNVFFNYYVSIDYNILMYKYLKLGV